MKAKPKAWPDRPGGRRPQLLWGKEACRLPLLAGARALLQPPPPRWHSRGGGGVNAEQPIQKTPAS